MTEPCEERDRRQCRQGLFAGAATYATDLCGAAATKDEP